MVDSKSSAVSHLEDILDQATLADSKGCRVEHVIGSLSSRLSAVAPNGSASVAVDYWSQHEIISLMKIDPMKIVFSVTCMAIVVVLCGSIFVAFAGANHGHDYVVSSPVAAVVEPCITIWLVGAGILWVYGFVILGKGWAQRSNARNLTLLFVLLTLSTFVSPYIYWKRETL